MQPLEQTPAVDRSTAKTISDVRRVHALYWKCFHTNDASVSSRTPPHRTSTAAVQKKRKRKDSDEEYTPHQKVGNNSTSSTTRRTSKRLAAVAELERPSPTKPLPRRFTFATKISSSSSSAVTTESYGSFNRRVSDIPLPITRMERLSNSQPPASGYRRPNLHLILPPSSPASTGDRVYVKVPSAPRPKPNVKRDNYFSRLELKTLFPQCPFVLYPCELNPLPSTSQLTPQTSSTVGRRQPSSSGSGASTGTEGGKRSDPSPQGLLTPINP